MTHLEFLEGQVADCEAKALASPLVNVRDRLLRSAAAWQVLVDREAVQLRARAART